MKFWIIALLLTACGGTQTEDKEICGDGFDNDGDRLADCVDPDCAGVEVDIDGDGVLEPCPEFCGDGIDNDGDGAIDCEDSACDGTGCPESCTDGRDNDKDGKWDCQDSDCQVECDLDGDGYYNGDFGGDDCDDNEPRAFPGNPEVCDEVDNDCDGLVDLEDDSLDDNTLTPWYADADGDGYGLTGDMVEDCVQPPGRVDVPGDCHDGDFWINPSAVEICDGLDNDCDVLLDDADPSVDMTTADTWFPDVDGDGFGASSGGQLSCAPMAGRAPNSEDCDDTNSFVGAFGMWVTDADGDGFGAGAAVGPAGCVPPGPNLVSETLPADCDDNDATVNPGAVDPCGDGLDDDCDGQDCAVWFDGFEYGLSNLWTTGGNANWSATTGAAHTGVSLAQCGNINDSQNTWLKTTATFAAGGTVRFWHKGDTENNYDYLIFYVNGVEQYRRAGNWAWTQASYPVTPGVHELEWRYQKDGSVSTGQDTVWIDDVTLEGANP